MVAVYPPPMDFGVCVTPGLLGFAATLDTTLAGFNHVAKDIAVAMVQALNANAPKALMENFATRRKSVTSNSVRTGIVLRKGKCQDALVERDILDVFVTLVLVDAFHNLVPLVSVRI